MPTYEYECQKCGHNFEAFQQMSDLPLTKCPECKGKVKKLISAGAGLLFKGSGFYITDYRSDSYKAGAKASKKSDKKDKSSTSSSKADSKKSEKPKKSS